ncbi:MAG: extracellular solute-binding protein [Armatimonadota bacterium]|nr:extracellular solute-binding protein [Armatimonadota bacterium]MDR7485929.1 extracellular solute-binding protein [Armatimonadota bacterium]MDR7533120.1 extracellular solute-binding protein [Armatimonadota bacterium]MDR7536634.1 extracellular solute-binding protein [Armatimonadota bacterium]
MRQSALLVLGVVAIAGAVGTPPARGQGGEIVMISYAGPSQEPHRFFLVEPFERAHPGTRVRLVPDEAGEYVARVQAAVAAGRPSPVDLAPNGEPPHLRLIGLGLLERTNPDLVPNLKHVHQAFVEKSQGYGVPATYSLIGIAYNSRRVSRAPTSWKDLWDPAYRGKVGLTSTASNLGLGFLVATAKINGGDEGNLDPAWQALRQLQPFVIAPNPTALAQLFEREEIVVGPLWSTDAAVLASKGLPIKFVKPQPGAIAIISFLSILRGSQHAQLAHELLDRVLSVEYQTRAAAKPYFFGPTNVKVPVPSEAAEYIPTTLGEVRRLQTVNWPVVVPRRAAIVERWNREFAR